MELWFTRHGSSSEAMLRKAGGEYCILSVTLGNVEHNISLDRKELKDLFNAIGNEICYWDEPRIDRHEVVMTREVMPRKRPPVIVPSPMKIEEPLTPEQWRESYAHYLAQSETLTVTDIHFDASKIDPENLEWAVAETKRVFGNRVAVEVFGGGDGHR